MKASAREIEESSVGQTVFTHMYIEPLGPQAPALKLSAQPKWLPESSPDPRR
jgi:hypothetical protein